MSGRARVTALWGLALAAIAAFIAARVVPDADFSAFLPSTTTADERLLVDELREGVGTRLVLIALAGAPPDALAQASRGLAAALAADPRFRYVDNGDAALRARDFAALSAHRYALSPQVTPERFAAEGLHAALAARVRALASGAGLFEKTLLPADPTGETLAVLARLAPGARPRVVEGVWFDAAGTRALLVAETRAPGSDLDGQAEAAAALQRAFDGLKAAPVALAFASPGTMAAESRALIAGDATRLSLVSTVAILLVLGLVYRNVAAVLLAAVPAACGLAAGVAGVQLAFGGVHAITLGFGATLLGESVDYPGYLLTQRRDGETPAATLARMRRMLALAVLTTAAAAAALLFAGFPGLAQLGVLTGIGVVVAGLATATLVPAWLPPGWRPPPAARAFDLSRVLPAPRVAAVLALVLLVLPLAASWHAPWWDDDLARMNPLPDSLKARDRDLRAALGAPEVGVLALVDGRDDDAVLAAAEALRPALDAAVTAGEIGGFDVASDYLPSAATQAARRAALPDDASLRAAFAAASADLPLRADAFAPFFAAVAAARSAPPVGAAAFDGTAIGLKLAALLRHRGGGSQLVVPLAGVRDAAALRVRLAALPARAGSGVRVVDLPQATRALIGAFRARALAAFAGGAAAIVVVLAIGLPGLGAALRVALPVAAGVVATAALLVAGGTPLSVFHLVALMLVAGIGTNYALFAKDARAGTGEAAERYRSLAVVAGTTLLAFGTLAFSRAPVLHAIGTTVALGVVACLAFTLLLVPLPRTAAAASARTGTR